MQQSERLKELRNTLKGAEREYVENRTPETLFAYLRARRAVAELECALGRAGTALDAEVQSVCQDRQAEVRMGPYSDRSKTIERLQTDLWRARREYELTKETVDRIMSEVPSGIPHPDGSLRIQKASMAFKAALQNYNVAMQRFSEFMLEGKFPSDLPPGH